MQRYRILCESIPHYLDYCKGERHYEKTYNIKKKNDVDVEGNLIEKQTNTCKGKEVYSLSTELVNVFVDYQNMEKWVDEDNATRRELLVVFKNTRLSNKWVEKEWIEDKSNRTSKSKN